MWIYIKEVTYRDTRGNQILEMLKKRSTLLMYYKFMLVKGQMKNIKRKDKNAKLENQPWKMKEALKAEREDVLRKKVGDVRVSG